MIHLCIVATSKSATGSLIIESGRSFSKTGVETTKIPSRQDKPFLRRTCIIRRWIDSGDKNFFIFDGICLCESV